MNISLENEYFKKLLKCNDHSPNQCVCLFWGEILQLGDFCFSESEKKKIVIFLGDFCHFLN
jgi:hypothetical protein